MHRDQIKQIIADPNLADELLSLNRKILDQMQQGLGTISDLRELALAWQRWQYFRDAELLNLVTLHSEKILVSIDNLEMLINYWYATPVKQLRKLIVKRLETITKLKSKQVLKLATIYSQSK